MQALVYVEIAAIISFLDWGDHQESVQVFQLYNLQVSLALFVDFKAESEQNLV